MKKMGFVIMCLLFVPITVNTGSFSQEDITINTDEHLWIGCSNLLFH